MLVNDLFTFLYPMVPLAGLIGYGPQIVNLARTKSVPQSISLLTWFIWTTAWSISLGYGIFQLQDLMFCVTASMNTLGHVLVIGLTLFKKYQYGEQGRTSTTSPLTPLALQN